MKRSLAVVRELLQQTSQRLAGVLIEQRDFAACIARHDAPGTFFYCDPPYSAFKPNGRYGPLGEQRTQELLATLRAIRGKFLMSFDHCAAVVRAARKAGLHVREVSVRYTIAGANRADRVREVLISNYRLPARAFRLALTSALA